jgi:hypothetical protein
MVTVAPATEQIVPVCELKVTGNPEDAVALREIDPGPNATLCSAPKLIVWLAGVTEKFSLTAAAAE